MFGHSRVLSGAWRAPNKALNCLVLLGAKATRRLRADHFMATKLTVSIKDEQRGRVYQEMQFPPARDDFTLLRALRDAFDLAEQKIARGAARQSNARRYHSVSVTLHGLKRQDAFSRDLFEVADDPDAKPRFEKLSDVMDNVNRRYGGNTLHLGTRREPPGGYAGAKIAFGRVPSFEDFSTDGEDKTAAN